MDSLANRQHNCGGSEELAILETAGSESRSSNCDMNLYAFLGSPFRACSSKTLLGVLGVARIGSE